ncbi:MAG: hypothetical protein Q9172_006720 [Xanthocarpia lactea]
MSRQMNLRLTPLDDVQRALAPIVTICCHQQFVLVAFVDDADALPRCGQTNALTAPCGIRVHGEEAQSIYKRLRLRGQMGPGVTWLDNGVDHALLAYTESHIEVPHAVYSTSPHLTFLPAPSVPSRSTV